LDDAAAGGLPLGHGVRIERTIVPFKSCYNRMMSPMRSLPRLLVLAAVLGVSAASAAVVRVPQDVRDLQSAIGSVGNGGTIELAAGTYPSPAAGFRIANAGKRFTLRAAPGARVVLDGGGSRPILDFANGDRSRGGE